MKIGAFAKLAEVPPSTLRYYEDIGLLPIVPRNNSQRIYSVDLLPVVRLIGIAKQAGFSLDEIKQITAQFFTESRVALPDWEQIAHHKLAELDQIIARYQLMRDLLARLLTCDDTDILAFLRTELDCNT